MLFLLFIFSVVSVSVLLPLSLFLSVCKPVRCDFLRYFAQHDICSWPATYPEKMQTLDSISTFYHLCRSYSLSFSLILYIRVSLHLFVVRWRLASCRHANFNPFINSVGKRLVAWVGVDVAGSVN